MNRSESKYFNTARCMDEAFLTLLEEKDFAYITVTEICKKAGVNRSTFYLHYETIADLLEESVAYINAQFASYFRNKSVLDIDSIMTADKEELYLITPQYLTPFLVYVKEHRRVFRTVMEKSDVLGANKLFQEMFDAVFSPIMTRFHVPEEKKEYLLAFTIDGIMGVVRKWLKTDCQAPIDFIASVIMECTPGY